MTGEAFYDRAFCRMVNRASLLLLDKALEQRPGLEVRVRRGASETRLRRDAGRLVMAGPNGGAPIPVDPRDPSAPLPVG